MTTPRDTPIPRENDCHWDEVLETHRRIVALYGSVDRLQAKFRRQAEVSKTFKLPPGTRRGVDLDRVFCALACKAATTNDALILLAKHGHGDNALALLRVLMENVVLLKWFLGGTGRRRLETYSLFTSVLHEKTVHMINRMID